MTFAQHSWQGCGWENIRHAGAAPVVHVEHASPADYPRPDTHDRRLSDPNDEGSGDGGAPAAWHDGARSCASGPPGYPWWVFAAVAVRAALLLARALRGRASRAC